MFSPRRLPPHSANLTVPPGGGPFHQRPGRVAQWARWLTSMPLADRGFTLPTPAPPAACSACRSGGSATGPQIPSHPGALYFLGPGGVLQSVSVITSPELRIGKPVAVPGAPPNILGLDAAPDGRLLLLYDDRSAATPVTLVQNWTPRSGRR
jgi:hypothetical protein